MMDIGDTLIGAGVSTIFWIFILICVGIGINDSSMQKDRMMKICIENGATYDQCLEAWKGK